MNRTEDPTEHHPAADRGEPICRACGEPYRYTTDHEGCTRERCRCGEHYLTTIALPPEVPKAARAREKHPNHHSPRAHHPWRRGYPLELDDD